MRALFLALVVAGCGHGSTNAMPADTGGLTCDQTQGIPHVQQDCQSFTPDGLRCYVCVGSTPSAIFSACIGADFRVGNDTRAFYCVDHRFGCFDPSCQ